MCICFSVLSIPAACEPRTDPQRACSICHPNWPVLTPPPPQPPLHTSPCCNATRALIYVIIKRSLHNREWRGGVGWGCTAERTDRHVCRLYPVFFFQRRHCRFKWLPRSQGCIGRGSRSRCATACLWMSKVKQLAYSSRTVQCPHAALHSKGGMGPNLNKKHCGKKRKKERRKDNVDLAASRQTSLSLSPLGMLEPQWGLTGWKSILCETPQWLRGLENVARD